MRILVVGCGGLGGWIAAELRAAGHDVLSVTRNPEIAESVNRNGYILRRGEQTQHVPGSAVVSADGQSGFDMALLATPPTTVEEATRAALPALTEAAPVIVLQNGVCETRVADIVGADRVIGAIVGWGGSMPQAGVYDRTSDGGFTVGCLDDRAADGLTLATDALSIVGPVKVTDNLLGARWSKLAINCAISALGTIGGDRLGKLIRHAFVRRMALEAMTEASLTAAQMGIQLEKISGTFDIDHITLKPAEALSGNSASLAMKHALLLAVGVKFRRLRSSMLAAIERGRVPPVDFINGEIVRHGNAAGVLTPMNHRMQHTIHAIASGELTCGVDLLRRVYAQSREEVREAVTARARADRDNLPTHLG